MDRLSITAHERAILIELAQGKTNREIAQALGVSVQSVKRYLERIMIKWNCANRTQVAIKAVTNSAHSSSPPAARSAHASAIAVSRRRRLSQ